MMTLGMETSTKTGSVALVKGGAVLAEKSLAGKMNHSEKLLPAVESILAEKKITYRDLDRVAVSIGPGSFTGLRIGLTVARAIAQMLKIEAVGVPTLDSLTYDQELSAPWLCPIIPGIQQQVYYAFYEYRAKGQWQPVTGTVLAGLGQLLLEAGKKQPAVIFTGEGLEIHQAALREALGPKAIFTSRQQWRPRASRIALLGEGRRPQSWTRILPLYIRPAEAELHWKGR